ncbi:helix-turn-helix domain-containing protein, partial [Yoonia sp. R2-816]|uniref:helix-turn-helix domain-containing protein n=1 Tax=Yoonia sp. R2-816 TaxID=3342638 RepID=UPI0037261E68
RVALWKFCFRGASLFWLFLSSLLSGLYHQTYGSNPRPTPDVEIRARVPFYSAPIALKASIWFLCGMIEPDTTTQKSFALAMKARREALSLSQHKLADLTGLSVTTINHTEKSKTSSDLATLEKIAFALNSNVAELLAEGLKILGSDTGFIRNVLADNVKKLRRKKGLSQADLALKSRLSLSTVQSVEYAKRSASIDVVAALAFPLAVHPYELLQEEEQDDSETTRD